MEVAEWEASFGKLFLMVYQDLHLLAHMNLKQFSLGYLELDASAFYHILLSFSFFFAWKDLLDFTVHIDYDTSII